MPGKRNPCSGATTEQDGCEHCPFVAPLPDGGESGAQWRGGIKKAGAFGVDDGGLLEARVVAELLEEFGLVGEQPHHEPPGCAVVLDAGVLTVRILLGVLVRRVGS